MAGTILGKRTRSTTTTASTPRKDPKLGAATDLKTNARDTSIRSPRRLVLNDPNDENNNPFVVNNNKSLHQDAVDCSPELPPAKKTRSSTRTATLKQTRLTPASKTIGDVFKTTKAGVEAFSDEKENTVIPRTPRHRDAAPQKVTLTPRHRILLAGTPRSSRTPGTPRTPHGGTAVYNQARQLFSRCSVPGRLVGREEERAEISGFLDSRLGSGNGGCLYVSGPPGTGKSALVNEVVERQQLSESVAMSVVNCMSVRDCKDLSTKLSSDLDLNDDAGFSYLKSCFVSNEDLNKNSQYLVVLDEVDRLVELDLSLLYSLIEWSLAPSSRLILIGIANALDLTDRLLPRLKSRNLKPNLLPFMPYSSDQITTVLTEKLRSLAPSSSSLPFMQPPAVAFCAKKVAAQTGDLRRAFDISRRAIDLVEQETRARDIETSLQESPSKTPLMENVNLSSPSPTKSPLKKGSSLACKQMPTYTIETAPKATIAHVSKITSLVFGNGTTQRLGTLNLQQRAVLCSLAALEKRKRESQVERRIFATPSKRENASAPSIRELYEAYCVLCKRENLLSALSSLEFRDVVSGLETLGMVEILDGQSRSGSLLVPMTPSRTPSRRGRAGDFGGAAVNGDSKKVSSVVGHKELAAALEGVSGNELLREILEGDVF